MFFINTIQKLEAKFRERPTRKDLTFAEAKKLLTYYEFKLSNTNGGSHYSVTHKGQKYPVTIADHEILKRYNVKDILKMIDQVKEDSNEKRS